MKSEMASKVLPKVDQAQKLEGATVFKAVGLYESAIVAFSEPGQLWYIDEKNGLVATMTWIVYWDEEDREDEEI